MHTRCAPCPACSADVEIPVDGIVLYPQPDGEMVVEYTCPACWLTVDDTCDWVAAEDLRRHGVPVCAAPTSGRRAAPAAQMAAAVRWLDSPQFDDDVAHLLASHDQK